eukprot:CAMPEP_0168589734 /NCGR_PEP_ID=MMETSP0420-20121227/6173_1 /TAXON_ID=498008 /ORGANISM="Pessonella sp." /LENGTH=320 /DNA_ID=CAMNT_0008625307 /DNA_START=1 /DNA_END=963 /DNA_ORIENTATION=+
MSIETVELSALVVLKIIKHCSDTSELVTGHLLGLDNENKLEITNCFPFPNNDDDDAEEAGVEYQYEMMRCLREANVDSNTVGWYQSTFLGSYLTEAMVETQYQYQSNIKESVVIVYDPLKTSQGALAIQAFRLTNAFMKVYKEGSFSKESLQKNKVTFSNIFEEIPIRIQTSILAGVLLRQLDSNERDASNQILNLNSDAFVEKNLELLIESVDELSVEQSKLARYTHQVSRQQQQQQQWLVRRKNENASRKARGLAPLPESEEAAAAAVGGKTLTEPSRLESLLLTRQLAGYCDQLSQHGGQAYAKRFAVEALRRSAAK